MDQINCQSVLNVKKWVEEVGACEISCGSHNPEDVIPACEDFLCEIDSQFDSEKERNSRGITTLDNKSETCFGYLRSLFETLNKYSPAGFYFGDAGNNRFDYGYWPVTKSLSAI